ncbi:MAG: DHH family phosphoesterase [Ruminococcus callidus]
MDAVHAMHEDGVELIVTVDNGITAIAEAELIADLGMTLVITDHHQPLETLPKAAVIVDAHRADDTSPFHDLCGAGVALKLVAVTGRRRYGNGAGAVRRTGGNCDDCRRGEFIRRKPLSGTAGAAASGEYGTCGAAGTAGKSGLLGKSFTSTSVAFGIAPRINAAGRFGSPKTAVELLLCEDSDEAAELAGGTERRNQARKAEEVRILEEIAEQAAENPRLLKERVWCLPERAGIMVSSALRLPDWKNSSESQRSLITLEGDPCPRLHAFLWCVFCVSLPARVSGIAVTPWRSPFGAGGFSLPTEHVERFRQAVQQYAKESNPVMPVLTLEADKLLMPQEITMENITGLEALAPFGEGNPVPVFAICHAVLQSVLPLSGGTHSKLKITYGGMAMDLLLFRTQTGRSDAENWRCVRFSDQHRGRQFSGQTAAFCDCQGLSEKRPETGKVFCRGKYIRTILPA